MVQTGGGLVPPMKERRHVAFGLKYPIDAPNRRLYAASSLRPDANRYPRAAMPVAAVRP